MPIRCPSCEAPLPEGVKFCLECGTRVSGPAPVRRREAANIPVPTCENCGAPLDPLSGSCLQCSQASDPTVPAVPTPGVPRGSLGDREPLPGAVPSFPPPLAAALQAEDFSELQFDLEAAAPPVAAVPPARATPGPTRVNPDTRASGPLVPVTPPADLDPALDYLL